MDFLNLMAVTRRVGMQTYRAAVTLKPIPKHRQLNMITRTEITAKKLQQIDITTLNQTEIDVI